MPAPCPAPPDPEYATLRRRIWRIYVCLVLSGVIGLAANGDRHRAISFLAGCAIGGLSLLLLQRFVDDLGGAMQGRRPGLGASLMHGTRLLILGGATFAMVKVYGASPGALAAGLVVPLAAIILEVVYELIYART
jgi:hypothetical protein